MSLKKINLVLILIFATTNSTPFINQVTIVLRGLLDHLNIPLKVTAMVCWSQEFTFTFLKSMGTVDDDDDNNISSTLYMTIVNNDDDDDDNTTKKFINELTNEHQNIIIVDLSCNRTIELLNDAKYHLYLRYKWFIVDSNNDDKNGTQTSLMSIDEKIIKTFEYLPALPSSEIFYYSSFEKEFIIKQVYRVSLHQPLTLEVYGILTENLILNVTSSLPTTRRRQNLMETKINAAIVITNNDSLNHLDDYRNKHIDTISKVNYILTNNLAKYLNAIVTYTYVDTWGYENQTTGKWSGMIGYLVDDNQTTTTTELGASPLFFTNDRILIIDYIAMTSATRSKFVFRSPKLSFTENVFLLPFEKKVWWSMGALILISCIFLLIAALAEWKIPLTRNRFVVQNDNSSQLRPSFNDALLLLIGATCQQGTAVTPRSTPARIITMLSFTSLMFLYTSYSANIVALLQSPSTKIQTLRDLLNSRLKFGVDDTVFNKYYFSHATEIDRKTLYEEKIIEKDGHQNFMNLEDGVRKMREGLFAFHMELGVGYKIVSETFLEYEKCGLQEIQYLQVIDPWYAIKKNSTYREYFKTGLLRMKEHGLQERENNRLYTRKPKCSGGGGNFVTVGLIDVRGALLVMIYGLCLSFLFLIIEIFFKKYTNRNNN